MELESPIQQATKHWKLFIKRNFVLQASAKTTCLLIVRQGKLYRGKCDKSIKF